MKYTDKCYVVSSTTRVCCRGRRVDEFFFAGMTRDETTRIVEQSRRAGTLGESRLGHWRGWVLSFHRARDTFELY